MPSFTASTGRRNGLFAMFVTRIVKIVKSSVYNTWQGGSWQCEAKSSFECTQGKGKEGEEIRPTVSLLDPLLSHALLWTPPSSWSADCLLGWKLYRNVLPRIGPSPWLSLTYCNTVLIVSCITAFSSCLQSSQFESVRCCMIGPSSRAAVAPSDVTRNLSVGLPELCDVPPRFHLSRNFTFQRSCNMKVEKCAKKESVWTIS